MGFSRESIPQRGASETKSTLAKVVNWEGNLKPPAVACLVLLTQIDLSSIILQSFQGVRFIRLDAVIYAKQHYYSQR